MRRCRETPDCWMSTASTSTCTARSPAPSVSTIRRRVESARTSNTTDSTRDIYTCVYIHFSALLDVSQAPCGPHGAGFRFENGRPPRAQGSCRVPPSLGTEGDAMERAKRGKEAAVASQSVEERLVRGLNLNLANMTSLATAYKQAHWNLQGPGFAQLHELFDRFADQTREFADLVAERAVQLHGTSHGTIEGAVKETTLPAFPLDEHREGLLLKALVDRAGVAIAEIRRGIDRSEEDLPTQDVYIEIARGLEKQEWMLRSHLTG